MVAIRTTVHVHMERLAIEDLGADKVIWNDLVGYGGRHEQRHRGQRSRGDETRIIAREEGDRCSHLLQRTKRPIGQCTDRISNAPGLRSKTARGIGVSICPNSTAFTQSWSRIAISGAHDATRASNRRDAESGSCGVPSGAQMTSPWSE